MNDSQINYAFMKLRIGRLLPKWNSALADLTQRSPEVQKRSRLKVSVRRHSYEHL